MKKALLRIIVVLMALIVTPLEGFAQSEQQGVGLLKEGIEIKNKAKSRADLERSLKKLQTSQQIFEKVNSEQGQAYALGWIGQVYKALGQYASALEYFEKSLTITRRIGSPKEEGITLSEIAQAYNSLGDYAKALDYYEKSLAITRRITDLDTEGFILNNMGLVYQSLGKYDKALEYLDRSLAITRKINDVKGEGSALNNIGSAHQSLGELDKALDHYNKSLEIRRKIRDVSGEGDTLNSIGEILRSKARYQEALDQYKESLNIKRKIGDLIGEGDGLNNIGLTYYSWGEYTKALDYYEKSLSIKRKISDISGESITLNNIAGIYDARGQYEKALEFYEKSLAINRKIGDVKGESTTLNNMGLVYKSLGHYPQALECLERSLEIRRKIGDEKGQGITLSNTGQIYNLQGRYSEALDYYEKSLGISKKVGDVRQQGTTLNDMGMVYQSAGRFTNALEYYEKSLAITREIKDPNQEGVTLNQIGRLNALMNNFKVAEKSMTEAIQIQQKIGVPMSGIRNDLANLYLDEGDLNKAEPIVRSTGYASTQGRLAFLKRDYPSAAGLYEKDLDSAQKTGNVDSLFRSCTGMARAYEEIGDYSKAQEYYEKALILTEEIRSGLLPSERKTFFEVKIQGFTRLDPAKGLTRIGLKLNRMDAGIESSELTKARAFSDHLAESSSTGSSGIPKETLEKEQQLVTRLASLKKDLAKTDKEKQPEKYDTLSKEANLAQKGLDGFVETLRKQQPAYAAAKYPRPVTLAQSALKPDECVVMFDLLGEGIGIRVIRDKKISKAFFTKVDQKEFENDVKKFRESFEKIQLREFDPDLAQKLYKMLLLEALSDIPKGIPLIIIPDGVLAGLPFDALVTGGKTTWSKVEMDWPERFKDYPDGLTYLGDQHPISYYQSITALTLARSKGNKDQTGDNMLVLADPVFDPSEDRAQRVTQKKVDEQEKKNNMELMATIESASEGLFKLNRLAQTSVLADNLKKIYGSNCDSFTGLDANKSDFLSKIAPRIHQYNNLVFATHGIMSTSFPGLMEPFLALTMAPSGTDGFLKMSDIMPLKMNADIVALTACQTGLGKELSGEGVMSMGRAFQYAGAKSVLMTLWKVQEKSATTLTENFFKYRKDGKTKLEALQAARDDIRKAGYKHPYFWSAFILVGETS